VSVLFLLLSLVQLDDPEQVWTQANEAYEDGRFSEAQALYESLIKRDIHNGKLHFNLANAYLKNQRLGPAILHYCKARKYMPNDPDIAQNLALADAQRTDPPIEGEDEAFLMGFDRVVRALNYPTLFFLAAGLLVIAGLASLILVVRPFTGKWLGYVLVIAGVVGIFLSAVTYVQHRQLTRTDLGVVVSSRLDVRAGPATDETISFMVHAGIRCRILDETEDWLRIGLANGYNGWVPRTTVAKI